MTKTLYNSDFSIDRRMLIGKNPEEVGLFLIDVVRNGVLIDGAVQLMSYHPNLNVVETETGFTAFHVAAAVGRQDLFDLFCKHANPDFQLKDARGLTMGDLASVVAQDYDLVEHIYELEAAANGRPALAPL